MAAHAGLMFSHIARMTEPGLQAPWQHYLRCKLLPAGWTDSPIGSTNAIAQDWYFIA